MPTAPPVGLLERLAAEMAAQRLLEAKQLSKMVVRDLLRQVARRKPRRT
jgi:hypothetical protein